MSSVPVRAGSAVDVPDKAVAGPAFPCTACGACCRAAHLVPGWPVRSDGACVHLQGDNTCGIYETRPLACRIDLSRPDGMSVREHHEATASACTALQRHFGVDPSYAVVLLDPP